MSDYLVSFEEEIPLRFLFESPTIRELGDRLTNSYIAKSINQGNRRNMNQIKEILLELHQLDIKLWLEEGRLLYDAPKDAMTPEILGQIKQKKSEIISFLQEDSAPKRQSIFPISRDEQFPLSFAQERLWFIDQLEGASPVYNLQKILKLQGELKIQALEKAISHLFQRHESLRTNFPKKRRKTLYYDSTRSKFRPTNRRSRTFT